MFVLVVTRGPDRGKKLPLEAGRTYTIGCNEDASLVLTDPLVLKGHCSLEVGDGAVVVRNHTATAGTFVGNQKISQATLKANATFRIGSTILGIAAAPAPAAPPTQAPPAPADPLIGRIVGGYKLNELVGAGGMGKVYRATQLSLHREVAFKVLRDQHAKDKNFRDLFINEARSAAQLVHPNVVQVYDAGNEGDTVFFSMEFIGKGSTEEILQREGKIPWEQAILMVLEAAHGLQYAESKEIVHRDIKPDNLMLNDDGRVKIADLGLAKRGEGSEDAGVIGTPHFIPPEQALGKQVDQRADIYSLGATFFRMITGKTLFSGKTAKEIVLKHIKEPPPAASSLDETVPDDLDLVIAKMLAKDPDNRYQSATELIKALEEVCAHHGIKGSIIRKGVGKRVLIPLLLLLLVAGGAIYYFAFLKGEDPEKARQRLEAIEAQKKAEEEARKRADENRRLERENRKRDAENLLLLRRNAKESLLREVPLSNVYEDVTKAPQLEARWLTLAKEFDVFGEGELAKEFEDELEYSSSALREAQWIRDSLEEWKASADDRREKGAAKLNEAQELDSKLRRQLAALRAGRKYEAAVNLCRLVATGKPAKDDPFGAIVNWEWVSPNASIRSPFVEFPKVKTVVDDSRTYFLKEEPLLLGTAKDEATRILEEVKALPEEADPAAIEAAIKKLQSVRGFIDEGNPDKVAEIQKFVGDAGQEQRRLEAIVARRIATLRREDRLRIRDLQRLICSLDPDAKPNLVMGCDFRRAIDEWKNLLVAQKIQTEVYRRFARERIAMLEWCEYLFARFYVDLQVTAKGAQPKPLTSLDLDRVPLPDEVVTGAALTGRDSEQYKFGLSKRSRQEGYAYGDFPMDWVYHSVFHNLGNPRWAEMTPELHFALGAFCFETMQYKDAQGHFDAVLKSGDERLGAAARSLRDRAQAEAKARAAYEALLQEFNNATTSAEMGKVRDYANTFRETADGTLFYLDVMDQANTADDMKKDFYAEDLPEVPEAPPPPAREE